LITVANSLLILLVICAGLAYLFGQGWLLVGGLLHKQMSSQSRENPLLIEMALALTTGLLINLAVVLAIQSIKPAMLICGLLAVLGLARFLLKDWRDFQRPKPAAWLGFLMVCLLLLIPIITDALNDWDGRSIWFFHAKMIYTAGTTGIEAGWKDPMIIFLHVDYPLMESVLAAQVATALGYWNEYFPKLAIFFLLVPGMAWLFSFFRKSPGFAFLVLIIPFSLTKQTWSGSMDACLAIYFSLALLLFGRYLSAQKAVDLVSSLACLLFLTVLKNEGLLAILCGLGVIGLTLLVRLKSDLFKAVLKINWRYLVAGLVGLAPMLLWSIFKSRWGMVNEYDFGSAATNARMLTHLGEGILPLLLQQTFGQIKYILLILALVYLAHILAGKPLVLAGKPALLTAGLYCIALILVYLMTPEDLVIQIGASINRTMLPVIGLICVGCFYFLESYFEQ
jgi:hypothetical protein